MNNKSSSSSFACVDKVALGQACETAIKSILSARETRKEKQIELLTKPTSGVKFFGLTIVKPKSLTREEALKIMKEDFYSGFLHGKQLDVALNLNALCRHTTDDKINVSSDDFSKISEFMPNRTKLYR